MGLFVSRREAPQKSWGHFKVGRVEAEGLWWWFWSLFFFFFLSQQLY